jgi:hypothetical protein
MRSPIAPIAPMEQPAPEGGALQAVAPIEARPGATAREGARGSRTFAELLAEAEAVRDHVDIQRRATGWRGGVQEALHGAASFLARQAPWMGLPLLLRRPAAGTRAAHGHAEQALSGSE